MGHQDETIQDGPGQYWKIASWQTIRTVSKYQKVLFGKIMDGLHGLLLWLFSQNVLDRP